MYYFKFKRQWSKSKLELECGTNNSSNPSVNEVDSVMNKLIRWSLGLSTLLGIWKYLILPILL